jgi:predicted secreted protein
MATTGVVNGTDLRVYKGGTVIGRATTCNFNVSADMREILDKDNVGGFRQYTPGAMSGTMSTDGFVAFDSPNETVGEMFTAMKNKTLMVCRFTTDEAGDTYWEASAYISSFGLSAAVEDNSTYSVEFQLTGEVTTGTES